MIKFKYPITAALAAEFQLHGNWGLYLKSAMLDLWGPADAQHTLHRCVMYTQ